MESFFKNTELFGHVIDIWAILLNLQEEVRAPESPQRLFCLVTLTNAYLENMQLKEEHRREIFRNSLISCIEDTDHLLRTIQILLLPVVRGFHIFLFVIDIKNPEFVVVDNSKADQEFVERYGRLPDIVLEYFVEILMSEYNKRKHAVEVEVAEFQKLPEEERKKILADAEFKIVDRFKRFS
ncbi:hypothetical protein L2E82_14694 [Cichorium intybus]|uniref:Uncharacterized protein n=1 Tax=Cichorium intybus TaxID=13427 RepID=A0ACB9F1B7_CICIN|nr:hypothetical protein L2E82_14694 [Cichorium intybus]